jgi:glucose/arabinose dehydrogenase
MKRLRPVGLVLPVVQVVALVVMLAGCSSPPAGRPDALGTPSPAPQPSTFTGTPSKPHQGPGRPHVVGTAATGLSVPWGIGFLPDGTALVSERDTTRVVAIENGSVRQVGRLTGAEPQGEAGALGLAISPTFRQDRLVYAYITTSVDNRVIKMRYDGQRLGPPRVVLKGIPNGYRHDGGRLLFAPDGSLFVSTGETGRDELAQDPRSYGGKILRITTDGKPWPGNPLAGSRVWTMGHRNVEGLAFDDHQQLWATEFGDQTWDELNRIDKGRNYGWPLEEGRGNNPKYRNPYAQWRTDEASPSGLAYLDGSLWAGALRGERLWRIPVHQDGTIGRPRDYFVGDFGRLRTVVAAPDGNLWVSTSNRDGRGDPRPKDDRILIIALR